MRHFFNPAIALMNRLTYPRKFAAISLLLILPLALVMALLIPDINRIGPNFAQKERTGTAYLRPLRTLLEQIPDHWAVARGTDRSAISASEAQIDASFADLANIDRQSGGQLGTTAQLASVQQQWQALKAAPAPTISDTDVRHQQLAASLIDLVAQVGNTSNLILDPDLDSYYLMDSLVLKLPELGNQLAELRVLGRQITTTGNADAAERSRLRVLSGLARSTLGKVNSGFRYALANNPGGQLAPAFAQPLPASTSAVSRLLDLIDNDVLGTTTPGVAPAVYDTHAVDAIAATYGLWDATVGQLDTLLQARINGFSSRMTLVQALALLAIALAAYLLVGLYRSIMATVAALDSAAGRMVSGDMNTTVVLATRDELADVVRSFNSVAERLRAEWLQAREERTRAAAAEQKFRAIFEQSADGIFQITASGRYLSANPALVEVYGYGSEAELREQCTDIANQLYVDQNRYADFIRIMRAEGQVRGFESQVYRKDGEIIWISENARAVADGEMRYYEGTVRDITARKQIDDELNRAKEAAEGANRAKSTFLANMSHELRTPLNAIIGYSEMLQEEAVDAGQQTFVADLEKIHTAGKHLLALINDILDLSKIEAGKMELYLERFDVAALTSDVVATIQPLFHKQANTLTVRCAVDIGYIYADVTKVRQSLFNVLSNASKFTERGTVTLEISREQRAGSSDWLVMRVSDSGIGMSAAQIQRLFQSFTQADASTTRKYGGTGLGLTITRRFCQLMGGDIAVESLPGVGSTFTIMLPSEMTLPEAAPADDGPNNASLHKPPSGASTVLVIDDDPAIGDMLTRFLSKEGFWVEYCADGVQGLAKARELRPNAIILDVLMPSVDGWSVLRLLKAEQALAETPVIMLTMTENREIGFALGAADFLVKPVEREQLVSLLHKHCHHSASILVVEDDVATRHMLRRMLEREGHTVREAENGRVALERVAAEQPALILLDLMMPEMDGFEFVAALHRRQEWLAIPILIVTAKDITADDRSRLGGHAGRIVQKGAYNRSELLNEVRDMVVACTTALPA